MNAPFNHAWHRYYESLPPEKQAAAFPTQLAALGALAGGAGGLGLTALQSDEDEQGRKKKRPWLRNLALGMGLGGAAGTGFGYWRGRPEDASSERTGPFLQAPPVEEGPALAGEFLRPPAFNTVPSSLLPFRVDTSGDDSSDYPDMAAAYAATARGLHPNSPTFIDKDSAKVPGAINLFEALRAPAVSLPGGPENFAGQDARSLDYHFLNRK